MSVECHICELIDAWWKWKFDGSIEIFQNFSYGVFDHRVDFQGFEGFGDVDTRSKKFPQIYIVVIRLRKAESDVRFDVFNSFKQLDCDVEYSAGIRQGICCERNCRFCNSWSLLINGDPLDDNF